jgi:hypothetical protein
MIYQALENTPIQVNLLTAINDTGWSYANGTATHIVCNAGLITLEDYPVIAGHQYTITYALLTISGGYLAPVVGGTTGTHYTSPNINVDTITATSNGFVQFYSNANCTVQGLNLKDITVDDPLTIVYAAINKKWSDTRTLYPEFGLSLYTNSVLIKDGVVYLQENGSNSRNYFFGVQYQSSIKFAEARLPTELKTYNSIALQSNQIMVTTASGITTNLGQVSSLIDQDFLKSALNDGVSAINVYSQVGIYSASFLKDQNQDIINGDALNGNYIIIELITENGNTPLQLYSIAVNASVKHIGTR